MLFFGGYLLDYSFIYYIPDYITTDLGYLSDNLVNITSSPVLEGIIYGLTIGIKSCTLIFAFIWVRASFPRIRFDQLMSFSWTILLPVVISFIVLVPCIIYSFEIIASNIYLL